MSPARLREIADTLPGYVCGQIKFHADAWERDIADVEHFRTLARGYMDERDEARAELAAALDREERLRSTLDELRLASVERRQAIENLHNVSKDKQARINELTAEVERLRLAAGGADRAAAVTRDPNSPAEPGKGTP